MAEVGNGGTSVPLSNQLGIWPQVEKIRGEVNDAELKAKGMVSARCGCGYIWFVSAHEAEKENGLKGETSPEEQCDGLVAR
jgi:hypothetical protein